MKQLIVCSLLIIIHILLWDQHTAFAKNDINRVDNDLTPFIENHPLLKGSLVGISIRSADTGELMYEYNGDKRLTPASNLKLITATTALATLGENYTFSTEIRTDGKIKTSSVYGNLYLVGKGDPTLLPEDIDHFAKVLKKKGIKKITGNLVCDATHFDDISYAVDVPWSDEEAYYGAAVSALTISPNEDYDTGTILLEMSPNAELGKKATITLHPHTEYVHILNHTVTVTDDIKKEVSITRQHGTNTIIIEGTIPLGTKAERHTIAVWEPAKYAITLFKEALYRNGIELEGVVKYNKTPENSQLIYKHKSEPLQQLLIPFMKLSKNSFGDVFIKEMGKLYKQNGTWENGIDTAKNTLTSLGVDANEVVMRDGSGISHQNLVRANDLTTLLYHAKQKEWFPVFYKSLPISGVNDKMQGGTLRNRMSITLLKEKVYAKTGTLTNVSTLSGYVKTNEGPFIFSILLNHLKISDNGKLVEDELLKLFVSKLNQ
ncbi:D-alanyl-D-alanine carboxypeptidase/D-alanyl-D-alanine endopeptidase [Metabacillus malikii]|uniref:D-alanyl-D-alanine carboxypeptidase/D-alanyl-D-alanine-endopeptidase (Penicillin-binding protein 4) n=1 Tax=Metabacillus malikii TaxID=1504265 RepID=A0ABT9ZCN6_9BACI|nr:D-alanyl-D-alanine carboxypeptidase/D-alanyl-D-alanine-endopeptidase [Metabacillus malikii]MDQ0230022.1 D-alanyl-D-alanine carboxypeptidase/D-alanyl-D-alanine-endopeptidase (penicillin-binding protein 4) [Metabacillus malikii]